MIDLNNPGEFKNLKLDDLIADAVERKDKKALEWLKEQATSLKTRTRDDGTTYEVRKSIVEIRANYLKDILKYKPKSEVAKERARQAKKEKDKKELEDKFAAAFAQL
jgi:hypothetical protein